MNSSDAAPQLCIVMPAYNEEGCITEVLEQWLGLLNQYGELSPRLVVVNDGSRDRTGELLDQMAAKDGRLLVVHQDNAGHGPALVRAYREALALGAEWIFHVDSDDQFKPEDFGRFWESRDSSHFMIGYRQKRDDPLIRLLITRILRVFNFVIFGVAVRDANIPYRLIKGAYLQILLDVMPDGVFAPNIFLVVLAARDKQPLMSFPVTHLERETGQISIVRLGLLKACWRCACELYCFRRDLKKQLRVLAERKKELGL